MVTQADCEALELMVDRCGLRDVVTMLAEVCQAKAAHLAHAWQDEASANEWREMVELLEYTAEGVTV